MKDTYHPKYRPYKHLPEHPLANTQGNVAVHRMTLYGLIGPGSHPCHWCGKVVEWKTHVRRSTGALHVDHVDGDKLNNSPENLVPACESCNKHRHRMIKPGEPFIVEKNGKRRRALSRICQCCGSKFLFANGDVRPSSGRYCSYQCRSKMALVDARSHAA